MRYVEEYRDRSLITALSSAICELSRASAVFMEVCGSHTMAIQRFGLRSLLPSHVELISGPGCPVCVTEIGYIDRAIACARRSDVILATFGDLLRVPGSQGSLEHARAEGADVRIVYSPLEALRLARDAPERYVVFLGIGFETTAPTTAAALIQARKEGLENFLVLSAHRLMKPAMSALVEEGVAIDGYICPGHVSVVTGTAMYEELLHTFGVSCVVSGFEPLDILSALYRLVRQIESGEKSVEIAYRRAVTREGNRRAWRIMMEVFEPTDAQWRGLGIIRASGLQPRETFAAHDALRVLPLQVPHGEEPAGCICGTILKGQARPSDCPLFASACTPESPVGACMVSSEGTCAAYYRYRS